MTHVILALSFVLVAGAAVARTAEEPSRPLAIAAAVDAAQATMQPQRRPEPPPPPPETERPRRRGSMVGYIQDAVVGSRFRVRFDSGIHNDAPDRAEFFYAKCGCYRDLQVLDPPAYDPEAPGPGPGIVADLNFQQLYVQGEYAITERFSAFGELPLRWIQPQDFLAAGPPGTFENHSGVSDLRAGVKLALASDDVRVVTVQFQGFFPTGQAADGLGTDHFSFEPALLFYQSLSNRIAVESQVGVWLPAGGSSGVPTSTDENFSGNVLFYGIGPSVEVYRGDNLRFAPVVELVGWRVLSGFATPTGDASGTNIVNLKLGGRLAWNGRNSLYVGWGHALSTDSWYDDIVRFEYRYHF